MKIDKLMLQKETSSNDFRVSIFGSAREKKTNKEYQQVFQLARMLAEKDIDVVTGGGPGLMQAANEGHKVGSKKTHAHSIGLGIKLPGEQKFNDSVEFKEKFQKFSGRLDKFMLLSNAVVVSPGGVGTLLELMYTWQLVQVEHICHIPIILLGDMWHGLKDWIKNNPMKKRYLEKKDIDMLYVVKTPREAIEIIDQAYSKWKKGEKDFCLNYKLHK
jgi:uncharacterized protein (TIGR00730 family)